MVGVPLSAFGAVLGTRRSRHASQSGRYARIALHDHETSEGRLVDLADPEAGAVLIAAREHGVQYESEHHPSFGGGDSLIIRTNADGAEDFKIMSAPIANPARRQWIDVVPYKRGRMIISMRVFRNYSCSVSRFSCWSVRWLHCWHRSRYRWNPGGWKAAPWRTGRGMR